MVKERLTIRNFVRTEIDQAKGKINNLTALKKNVLRKMDHWYDLISSSFIFFIFTYIKKQGTKRNDFAAFQC